MILGVGTDLVSVARMAAISGRHRERFLDRCFSFSPEDAPDPDDPRADLVLARHWALKEAFLKAIGTEVRKIPYRDIAVSLPRRGSPLLDLHGLAKLALQERGAATVTAACSGQGSWVMGLVVLEG